MKRLRSNFEREISRGLLACVARMSIGLTNKVWLGKPFSEMSYMDEEEHICTDECTKAIDDELGDSSRDDLALPESYPEAPINDPAPTGSDPWRPCQAPEEYERRRKNEN